MSDPKIYRAIPKGEAGFLIEARSPSEVRDYLLRDTEIRLLTNAELRRALASGESVANAAPRIDAHSANGQIVAGPPSGDGQ